MTRYFQITGEKVCECQAGEAQLLVYVNPDDAQKKQLVSEYKVDDHTLGSALDPDELSRLEFEPDHAAFIVKRPRNYSREDNFLFKTASLGAFLFKNKLIIVVADDIPLFEGRQFAKVHSLEEVFLKVIYRFILHFLEHLKVMNMISGELEQKINESMENRYLLNLFTLSKGLVYYLNAIASNSALLEKFKHNAPKMGLSAEAQEILDDIIIENNQCYKQSEIYSNILASLMDARASIVSNNLNLLMKTLNAITIGIMVPTFVVSAFSMNVPMPFPHHPVAFWAIMGLALGSMGLFVTLWRFKKW